MFGVNGRLRVLTAILILCICFLPVCLNAQKHGPPPSSPPPKTSAQGSNPDSSYITGGTTVRAEDEPRVEFKTETVLIQFPVAVTDKSGNRVLNLKKDDFQVLENGKEQQVATFEEVVANKSPSSAAKPNPGEFSNLTASEGEPRSVTVVALDTVNTPLLDQTYGRKQLLKYLAQNLDSRQVFGLVVITGSGLKVVHGLTGDSRQLIDALNKVSGENPALAGTPLDAQVAAASGDAPSFDPTAFLAGNGNALTMLEDFANRGDAMAASFKQDRAIETTMQAFLGIAWSLSGIPGKKSVIWATGGMPFYLDSPSTVPGGYLSSLYEHTMNVLSESNIAVYPVDVRGLVNDMPAAEPARASMPRNPRSNDAMRQVSNRNWLNSSSIDTLKDFAAMTGGIALYNNNDISGLFKRAVDDSSAYYLVGYYLDTKNTKPGWRQLKVKLRDKDKEKGTELRARSGFFVTNAPMNPDIVRTSDLDLAALSPFDSTGLPMTVKWLGTSSDGGKTKVQFGLQLPSNALTLGAQNLLNFDYLAMAYVTKDGKQANSITKNVRGNIAAERVAQFQAQGVGFKNELELVPGQYTVRFVVRDDVTGKVGSVSAPLTVN